MLVPLDEEEAAQLAEWAAKQTDLPLPRFFDRLGEVAAEVKAHKGPLPSVVATPGLWEVIMDTAIMHGVPGRTIVEAAGDIKDILNSKVAGMAAALDARNVNLDPLLDKVTALLMGEGKGIIEGALIARWYIAQVGMVNGLAPQECAQLASGMVHDAALIMQHDPEVQAAIAGAQAAGSPNN